MIKKIKNLLRKLSPKKKESDWTENEDGSITVKINSEIYLQDSEGMHMVYVHSLTITNDGSVLCDYTSSSDLQKRGLIKHMNDVVLKLFFNVSEGEMNGRT